jgi:uncharacterized membrane protein YdjX (TVP38/TMEM64 family)
MIRTSTAIWTVVGLLCLAVLIGLLDYYDAYRHVVGFLQWLERHDDMAPLVFIVVDMLVVVLVLPGVVLTLGAGFLFGVAEGTLYVVIATTSGATIAFLAARYLFSSKITDFFMSHPRLKLVNVELAGAGWKIVLLTRLIPFFPFKLSNYFFGLTTFSLRGYIFGTLVGIIPITIFNVYVGSLAADLTRLATVSRSPLEWTLYGSGVVIAFITVMYIKRLARRALDKYIPRQEESHPDDPSLR